MKEKREAARREFMLRLLENAKAINEAREDIENIDVPDKEEKNG